MKKHMLFVGNDGVENSEENNEGNYAALLSREGFDVAAFADRQSAMRYAMDSVPDLALLDISLRGERDGGLQLCADLRRQWPQLPIIFFTAHDSEQDEISGIRLGADAFFRKSVSVDYLIIRIESLLRRLETLNQYYSASAAETTEDEYDNPLRIDTEKQILFWHGEKVNLSLIQFWITKTLAENPGQARNVNKLMRAANLYVEPNTIAAHIKTIRQRFRAIDPGFDCIKTERGLGYRWLDV